MKFSVCTDIVLKNMPTADAIKELGSLGYTACEFWQFWDKDLDAIIAAGREHNVKILGFLTKGMNLVDRSQRGTYLEGLKVSVDAANRCGAGMLLTQVGNDTGASRERQMENITETLNMCGPILDSTGITLLVEPLNLRVNRPGYFLYSTEDAVRIIKNATVPGVKILFDIYHQQIMEGNLTANILENIGMIGHFHAAGCPGRGELTTGEINYPNIFSAIEQAGYEGYMGLEYFPTCDPIAGLRDFPWR